MKDHELDELLRHGAAPPSASAATGPAKRRSWLRRPVLAGGVLAGVVVLTGAASLTAHQLSVPPFQTIPDGIQRLDTPIPLDYERTDGTPVRCKVFMEFEGLSRAQLQRIDHAVARQGWSPERQRQLIGRPDDAGVPRSESQVFTNVLPTHLDEFATDVVPDLIDHDDEGPNTAGFGASCREAQK